MSLRDWRSQRAQWDGHLMVVTAACPEPVQGQQLPCSGQGMRSEVRLAVLQKLLRWAANCMAWQGSSCLPPCLALIHSQADTSLSASRLLFWHTHGPPCGCHDCNILQLLRQWPRSTSALLLCSCMPGWALSMRVTVPASSTGGPLAASIIITVPSAWTEDMITSLPQVS